MQLSFTVETIPVKTPAVKIAVPLPSEIKRLYEEMNKARAFPYWAKIWPAAKALAQFIIQQQQLVADKKVVEIAGGLGLPSLIAASFANEVMCTDAAPEALEFVNTSVELNSLTNITTTIYDWNDEATFDTEVLLMSDVNYHPADFPQLLIFFQTQLKRDITIILSTPQRLMAKPFIEAIAEFIIQQEDYTIEDCSEITNCTVFVLKAS